MRVEKASPVWYSLLTTIFSFSPYTVKSTSQSKDQQILVMNAMQSVTADKLDTGVTYLQTMKDNLEVLKQALN